MMVSKIQFFSTMVFLLIGLNGFGQDWMTLPSQEEELGLVHWLRTYKDARSKAIKEDKPLFILFQEVPGCSTCKNYGNNLLTHPHIVEAIESHFIPLTIHNNKGGKDAEILRKFGEPSWNNPVVRIIDADTEQDITKRLNGRYDMKSLVATISNGLLAANTFIPEYLKLLEQEYSSVDLRETHLAMYCFWSGEKHLGNIEGVLGTNAGFMNGSEVVKVRYNANEINEKDLFKKAASNNSADAVYSNDQREIKAAKKLNIRTKKEGTFRTDKEPKYYTFKTKYRYLPMTQLQALKVNSALANGNSPDRFLSPRQLDMLEWMIAKKIASKIAIDKDFTLTWNAFLKQKDKKT